MKDITMRTLAETAKLLKHKEISPVELTEACLQRTEEFQDDFNAFITITRDEALTAAKNAEKEILNGNYKGTMHGIPISIKDMYYTKGIRTTAGSAVLADYFPTYNATIVQNLLDAGAIMTGKTNTQEFAFGPTAEDSYYGPSRNPWNPKKISGGSSGGTGIAVATGMSFLSMGTDTGGSVRIPASFCGIVGFKPTYGRTSSHGVVNLSYSLDHPGPLTRSVLDAAISMDYITAGDVHAVGERENFETGLANVEDLKGKVIGVPVNFFFDKTDEEVEKIVRQAIENLEKLGATVLPVSIPGLDLVPEASTTLMYAEAAYIHKDNFETKKKKYTPAVRERLEQGQKLSALEYIQSLKDKESLSNQWDQLMANFDAIVSPTVPVPPYDLGLPNPWEIQARGKTELGRVMCTYHTRLSCMTGTPSLSIPCGFNNKGLPVGFMFMGRRNNDLELLRIGYAYEKAFPFQFKNF